MTRIFTGTIGPTVSLITLAIVATNVILTSSLLANIFYQTFVDVMLTMVASKTRVLAIALVVIEQIRALTSVTRIGSTFINVFFAVASRVPRWTGARVRLEKAWISHFKKIILKQAVNLTRVSSTEMQVAPFLQGWKDSSQKSRF